MQPTRQRKRRHITCRPHGHGSPEKVGREGGFTLVEMLVVISIIGVLAAILVPTVGSVIRTSKLNAIAVEVASISQAIESYKLENNDYPPDFSNTQAVVTHTRRAFQRNTFNVGRWLVSPPQNAGDPDPRTLDPAEALVFWLSGLKANPRNPFTGTGETKTYFDFKEDQLTDIDGDGWPEYASEHAQGVPYVYFDGRITNDLDVNTSTGACFPTRNPAVCAYAWAVYPPPAERPPCVGRKIPFPLPLTGGFGVARPYRSNTFIPNNDTETFPVPPSADSISNSTVWMDAGKFQVIAPGLDQAFGADHASTGDGVVYKTFPTPNYYNVSPGDFSEDADNVASFSENQTIEGAIP